MDYTITLTDVEVKALEYAVVDNYEWIENAATHRARVALIEIIQLNTQYCNANSIPIAVGEAAQVDQAYELGVIKTLKEVSKENEIKFKELDRMLETSQTLTERPRGGGYQGGGGGIPNVE